MLGEPEPGAANRQHIFVLKNGKAKQNTCYFHTVGEYQWKHNVLALMRTRHFLFACAALFVRIAISWHNSTVERNPIRE